MVYFPIILSKRKRYVSLERLFISSPRCCMYYIQLSRMAFFLSLFVDESLLHDYLFFNWSMTQPAPKEIMDVLVANQAASRNFVQNFQYEHHIITHQHHIQVELTDQKAQSFQIINHFATIENNKVFKVTEIMLENRTIKIIDTFTTTTNNAQKVLNSPDSERVKQARKNHFHRQVLAKKYVSYLQGDSDEIRHRDTKNLVKNVFRVFQAWVEAEPGINQEVCQGLAQLTKKGRFNNNLILELSQSPPLRKAFLLFSDGKYEDMINRSKINDKKSHIEALKRYENVCREEEDLQEEEKEQKLRKEQYQVKHEEQMCAREEVKQQDG